MSERDRFCERENQGSGAGLQVDIDHFRLEFLQSGTMTGMRQDINCGKAIVGYPYPAYELPEQTLPPSGVPLSKPDIERANKIANDLNHGDVGSMQGAVFQLQGMVKDDSARALEVIALARQNSPNAKADIVVDQNGFVSIVNPTNCPGEQVRDVGNLNSAVVGENAHSSAIEFPTCEPLKPLHVMHRYDPEQFERF